MLVDDDELLARLRSRNGYYRRVGSSKREIPPEALARLFQQRSQSRIICFDEQIVAGAPRDALIRRIGPDKGGHWEVVG